MGGYAGGVRCRAGRVGIRVAQERAHLLRDQAGLKAFAPHVGAGEQRHVEIIQIRVG